MSDDFAAFKSDDDGPPDGTHTVTLARGHVFESQRGDTFVKCEWQTTDYEYYFESLHGTKGNGRGHTKRLLAGLGIDLARQQGWDDVNDALALAEGNVYEVKVAHKGEFLNVSVEGRGEQTEIPIDTAGLPAANGDQVAEVRTATPTAGGLFDDDDIPF